MVFVLPMLLESLVDSCKILLLESNVPDGMKFKELRIMGENRFGSDTKIPFTSQGMAPCWAYRLIIGATGQSMTIANEDKLKRLEQLYENEQTRIDIDRNCYGNVTSRNIISFVTCCV
jgi:hypothetical protein